MNKLRILFVIVLLMRYESLLASQESLEGFIRVEKVYNFSTRPESRDEESYKGELSFSPFLDAESYRNMSRHCMRAFIFNIRGISKVYITDKFEKDAVALDFEGVECIIQFWGSDLGGAASEEKPRSGFFGGSRD